MSQEIMEKIKKTHENITLSLGTLLSLILIGYFMSYSALANSHYTALFWFEMISSIFIVMALFYIQRIALFFTKLRFTRRADYQAILQSITLNDLK